MKISQEVRDFAKANPTPTTATVEEAEAGMHEMAERYREGGDLYVPAE
jgi:phosphomethylpyrimidine synthase